jgi:hypothetical protein
VDDPVPDCPARTKDPFLYFEIALILVDLPFIWKDVLVTDEA